MAAPGPPQPDCVSSQKRTSCASPYPRRFWPQNRCVSLKEPTATFSSEASSSRRCSAWGPCACVAAPLSPTSAKKFWRKTMLRTPRRRMPPMPRRPPVISPRRSSTFERSSSPSRILQMCAAATGPASSWRQQPFELLLRIRGEPERELAIDVDDRTPHAPAVLGEPADQLVAGEAFRFLAPLGRNELLRAAGFPGQRAQLGRAQRLLDQVAFLDLLLLSREKLPRLHAAGSAGLAVVPDHGDTISQKTAYR